MIFIHCDKVLELTLVCPTFNDIILKSALLMRRMSVMWFASESRPLGNVVRLFEHQCNRQYRGLPANYHRTLMHSERKYGSLCFAAGGPDQWEPVNSFIEKHQDTLTDLQLYANLKLEPLQIFKILSALSVNLKTLTTMAIAGQIGSLGSLEFPNLKEWTYFGEDDFMFKDWKTPKLKKFMYLFRKRSPNSENLIIFLRKQPQLQDLMIEHPVDVENFLKADIFTPFPFNLTKLNVHGYRSCSETFPYVESQEQSLTTLALGSFVLRDEDFKQILKMDLKELELTEIQFHSLTLSSDVQSQTIDKLRFSRGFTRPTHLSEHEQSIIIIIKSCPNVETLSFHFYDMTREMSKTIAATKIKKLSLFENAFKFPLQEMEQFPHLETFSAEFIRKEVWGSLVAKNPQLRSVKTEYNFEVNKYGYVVYKRKYKTLYFAAATFFLLQVWFFNPNELPEAIASIFIFAAIFWSCLYIKGRYTSR